jgi:predicted lipoprotein
MSARRSRRPLRIGLAIGMVAGVLMILRPWTIVPIETSVAETFDPDGYVAAVWDSRVLPSARAAAADLQAFMQNPLRAEPGQSARAAFVKGTATVVEIDRTSRIGLARLRLPWAAGAGSAAIQIGPVLRGTAVRDALEFIQFTDFTNQLEFAAVANALNGRVLTSVLGPVDTDSLAGREVAFVGAVALPGGARNLEIVPLELRVVESTP